MNSSSSLSRTRHDLLFHSIAYLFNRGIPLLAVIAVAPLLGPQGIGHYVGAISLFGSLLLLVDLGLSLAVTTTIAKRATDGDVAARESIGVALMVSAALGGTVAIFVLVLSNSISEQMFGDAKYESLVIAGSVYVPFAAISLTIGAALQGLQRYRQQATIGALFAAVHLLVILTAAASFGVTFAIWGAAVTMIVRAALSLYFIRSFIRIPSSLAVARQEFVQLAIVAVPACLAAFAMTPATTIIVAALFRHPNGAIEAGAFGLTLQLFALAMFVPGVLTQFALPRMSQMIGEADQRKASRKSSAAGYALLATGGATLIAAPVIAFSGAILPLLRFPEAYSVALQIMMLAAIVAAPQGVLSNYLLANGQNWGRVLTMYAWPALVLCMLIGAPLSAVDATITYLAAWGCLTFLQTALVLVSNPANHPPTTSLTR